MTGILKFNLPEEREDFELAVNARKLSVALWEIRERTRSKLKYSEEPVTGEQIQTIIWDVINEYGVIDL